MGERRYPIETPLCFCLLNHLRRPRSPTWRAQGPIELTLPFRLVSPTRYLYGEGQHTPYRTMTYLDKYQYLFESEPTPGIYDLVSLEALSNTIPHSEQQYLPG
jgi:hypothetical protein